MAALGLRCGRDRRGMGVVQWEANEVTVRVRACARDDARCEDPLLLCHGHKVLLGGTLQQHQHLGIESGSGLVVPGVRSREISVKG